MGRFTRRGTALALLISVAVGAILPRPAAALPGDLGEGPVEITADRLRYEQRRSLYVAEGNVRMVRGGRSIEAEWVVFSRATDRGVASGHVRYLDGEEELRASFLQFDLESLRGLIYDGEIDTGPGGMILTADRLIKTGDETYQVRRGVFTTCRCPDGERDPWAISAGDANLEIGRYVTGKNTTLEVLGVPVVWLPWMIFPIKTERESGLLMPYVGVSDRNGWEVGLPLFWAATDDLNVTFTPTYLSDRGFKPILELEYVMGERSHGSIFGSFLNNDEKRQQRREQAADPTGEEYDVDRWGVLIEHDQFLPSDWRLKADVKLVSDNEYVDDFRELWDYRFDRYLESEIFGFGQFGDAGGLGFVGSVVYADDLQAPDSRDRDEFMLQRLPRLTTELLSTRLERVAGVVPRMDVEYTYFWNQSLPQVLHPTELQPGGVLPPIPVVPAAGGQYLDVGIDGLPRIDTSEQSLRQAGEDDGRFQEGEALADRGHRLVVHPRVSRPTRLFDWLEVYPEIGYRELLYWTEEQDFSQQGHVTARVDLRSRLQRRFESGQSGQGITHIVEPVVAWTWIENASLFETPIFVPETALPQTRMRQLERTNLVVDPTDQIDSRHSITAGVTNRFYRGNSQIGELNLYGDYSWLGSKPDRASLVLDGFSTRLRNVETRFNLVWDIKKNEIEEGLFSLSWLPLRWLRIDGSYRYRDRMPRFFEDYAPNQEQWPDFAKLSQIVAGGRLLLGERWTLYYRSLYDFELNDQLRNGGGIEFRSRCKCWAVGLEAEDDNRGGVRVSFRYSLLGLGDDNLSRSASPDWQSSPRQY